MLRLNVFIFVSIAFVVATEALPFIIDDDTCVIDVQKDLGEPQPLLLDPSTDDFLYPHSSQGLIEIDARETIKLYCSNGFRTPLTSNGSESLLATCVSRKTFSVNKQKIDFSKIACNDAPAHTQKRTNETCSSGVIVEIGFQTDRKWLRLMRVCHNEERGATNWVQYNQKPENRAYQRSSKRVDFRQGDGFYEGLQVDELYSKNIQRLTCACILNSTPLCNELIPNEKNSDLFLSRGHLAARSDFIYGVHQQASFYFLNAAPQWQTFNGGNWAILEEKLKAHVDRKNLDVDIYTGTHGTLSYADIEGVSREIFLSSKGDSPKVQKIPVPKIYYKIVIAPQQRAGIAFIGVNDPYATKEDILSNFIYCDNVINHVSYIPWKSSLRMGYMYACAVDEFTKYVKELPKLPTIDHVLL